MLKKRMNKKRKRILSSDEEIDPMIYAVNMVDCMLVLALGFLIFTVMSMSMQSVLFSDMTPQEKQSTIQSIKQAVELNQGKEVNNTTESSGSGAGYEKQGIVYKDPKTGKLIMIQGS